MPAVGLCPPTQQRLHLPSTVFWSLLLSAFCWRSVCSGLVFAAIIAVFLILVTNKCMQATVSNTQQRMWVRTFLLLDVYIVLCVALALLFGNQFRKRTGFVRTVLCVGYAVVCMGLEQVAIAWLCQRYKRIVYEPRATSRQPWVRGDQRLMLPFLCSMIHGTLPLSLQHPVSTC